jgi:hypothetical protein
MVAKAGEKARETGDFVCKSCDEIVHLKKGQALPKCDCGATQFDERRNEPGNKSSSPGRTRAKAGEHRKTGSTARKRSAGGAREGAGGRKATSARKGTARRGTSAGRGGKSSRAGGSQRKSSKSSKSSSRR